MRSFEDRVLNPLVPSRKVLRDLLIRTICPGRPLSAGEIYVFPRGLQPLQSGPVRVGIGITTVPINADRFFVTAQLRRWAQDPLGGSFKRHWLSGPATRWALHGLFGRNWRCGELYLQGHTPWWPCERAEQNTHFGIVVDRNGNPVRERWSDTFRYLSPLATGAKLVVVGEFSPKRVRLRTRRCLSPQDVEP